MTTHHHIQIASTSTEIKATYRDGKFRKLEHFRGKLDQQMMNSLGKVIPVDENELPKFIAQFKERVIYTTDAKKEVSLFSKFNAVWFAFYQRENKRKPKFDGSEGKALHAIIAYLKQENNNDEQQALANWQLILDNWKHLPEFYQKKQDLKKINSNFNVIITELTDSISKKRGASHSESRKKANDIADKYF
jgi:hypothetical protein